MVKTTEFKDFTPGFLNRRWINSGTLGLSRVFQRKSWGRRNIAILKLVTFEEVLLDFAKKHGKE